MTPHVQTYSWSCLSYSPSRGITGPAARLLWYPAPVVTHSALPAESEARTILDTTQRHREWINVPLARSGLRVFAVYPGLPKNFCSATQYASDITSQDRGAGPGIPWRR